MYTFVKEQKKSFNSLDTAKKLEQIESNYGISFPAVWRKYILAYDGAKIHLKSFRINGYLCEISKIIPLSGDHLTFEKIVDNDRADGFISKEFYPIASNRGGDLYYWDAQSGAIYLVLADNIEHPFMISSSVDDFFDLLG